MQDFLSQYGYGRNMVSSRFLLGKLVTMQWWNQGEDSGYASCASLLRGQTFPHHTFVHRVVFHTLYTGQCLNKWWYQCTWKVFKQIKEHCDCYFQGSDQWDIIVLSLTTKEQFSFLGEGRGLGALFKCFGGKDGVLQGLFLDLVRIAHVKSMATFSREADSALHGYLLHTVKYGQILVLGDN